MAEEKLRQILEVLKKDLPADSVSWLNETDIADHFESTLERLEAQDLWGGRSVFVLRLDTERQSKKVITLIKQNEARPLANVLVILARTLKYKGAMNKAIQSSNKAVSFVCGEDTAADLAETLGGIIASVGAKITDDALHMLAQGYLGNRNLAITEAEKLGLYGLSLGRPLEGDDVQEVTAAKTDFAFQELVHPLLEGDMEKVPVVMGQLMKAGKAEVTLLRALQNEIQRMIDVKQAQASGARNAKFACRPPVFDKEWPAFQARLQKWPMAYLVRVLERIAECEALTRLDGQASRAIVLNLFCELAQIMGKKRV